jgi:transporter family-2 protein
VLGALIATTLAVVVARLGVLGLMLAVTAGQVAGGLVIDLVAPVEGAGVDAGTIAGVALAIAAVLVSGRHSV